MEDSQITNQPNNVIAHNARLYSDSSWCNSSTNAGDLQVDLGKPKTVTGLAIQGDPSIGKSLNALLVGYRYGSSAWHWSRMEEDLETSKVCVLP